MKKSWGLIPKILSGEKTVESRWYQSRRTPWDRIKAGDTVFFKNSGEPVIACATADEVLQFEIRDFDHARELVKKYVDVICLPNRFPETWGALPKYCVLIRLAASQLVSPFYIDKRGFGGPAAWLTVEDIVTIMQKEKRTVALS